MSWLKWLCFALLLLAGPSLAFTCTSTGGNWNTAGTWTGCNGTTPQAADTVVINSGTVILNTSSTISGLTLNGGTLTFGNSGTPRTLTVNGDISVANGATVNVSNNTATHVLNVSGDITNNGTFDLRRDSNSLCTANFTGGGTHTVDGSSAGTTEFYNVTVSSNLNINKSGAAITQTGTLSVTGNLAVQAGTINVANAITVTGTTSISGTLRHTTTTGTRTFTGNVTINNGGTMSETVAEPIAYGGNVTISAGGTLTEFGAATMAIAGNLQNDGTLTASTGVHTFTGAGKTFSGANEISIPSVTISGTYTNSGTLTVGTALSGGGALSNGATGTLNIGGTSGITTLNATAAGNLVNYTGTGQTLKVTAYHHLTLSGGPETFGAITTVAGNLTLSGAATATTAANLNIGGNLDVGSGTQFTVAGFNIAVTAATSVTGTLTHSSATGTKTYTGNVTVNNGGTWNETSAAAISFGGNLQNDGTFTSNTGVHTFTGATKTFSGANAISIPSATVTGTYTNNGTLTVSTTLAGAGTLTNGSAGTLNVGAATVTPTLTATAVGNTVNYTGAAQTVKAASYHHLGISGSLAKTLGGDATVAGTLTLASGTLAVGGNTLTLNGPAIAGAGAATALTTTSSSNLVFGGNSAGVSLPGSVTALNDLGINNGNGITMGGIAVTTTLSGTLALGANTLTTGSNTLNSSGDCTASGGNGSLTRTSGYVIGNLRLRFPLTVTSSTCIYHVGDSIGYAPITLTVGPTTGGTLTGHVDAGDHPDTVSSVSGIDAAKSANHYWTLTAGSLSTSVDYSATFQFCANTGSCVMPTEVDTGVNTGNFVVARKLSGTWSTPTPVTTNAYSTTVTGITTGFGEFAVGEINRCFADGFTGADGASPGTNWSVGNQSGTFGNPVIFGNRLRLTDASTAVATWATLQRPFPAAGNRVTVEFQYFGDGGSTPGADGVAVVLSDASVAAQAGAFGGSLGYAQKAESPVSDCVIPGGCPGFAGGWLGVGLDEYGNYSTNLEGRYGGSATRIVQSAAMRGSGSGLAGYRFIAGTSTLSPPVDGNGGASPPHQYRIIVDHMDGVHAWASIERDTSGGGTAYTTLLGPLDILDPGYSQNAIPVYLNLSLTGSTGASTNIHEIDNLRVCTFQGLQAPTLHHIEINHGGSACTSSPANITIKACANANCSTLYMNSVTVDLTNIAGATWSTDPVTFTGGQTTVTLTKGTTGAVTLGGMATSPTTGNPTRCFNGTTETCTLTFSVCTFDVIEVGEAAGTPIFTKLANRLFNLDVYSLAGGNQTVSAINLVDASSGTCSTFPILGSTSTALPSNFTNTIRRRTFAFTYNNAAPNVRVRVTSGGPIYSCSTDNFAIRPQAFTVTSTANNASPPPGGVPGTTILRAGSDGFPLTATAVYGATTTTGYAGTPKINSSLVTTSLPNVGILASVSFPTASAGVSTASGFKYSEVGNFSLSQYGVYDETFADVDSVKGECTPGFSNTLDGNGKYSCQFGSAAVGPFGRFVPDHFTVGGTIANACAAGAFTYMGQSFNLSTANVLDARNFAEGVTANYAGAYAPGSVGFGAENADNGTDLSARLSFQSGSWTSGIYTLTGTSPTFSRLVTPDGSFESLDIGLTVNDADVSPPFKVGDADMNPSVAGGSSFAYKKFSGSPLRVRFGILKLDNAYGSELLSIRVPVRAMYWNGSAFITNPDDACTQIAPANLAIGNYKGSLSGTNMGSSHLPGSPMTLSAGTAAITVTKPSPSAVGSVDLAINLGATSGDANCIGAGFPAATTGANLAWLRGNWCGGGFVKDPNARLTFGTSRSPFIYLREMY